jgi:hypothetical protein
MLAGQKPFGGDSPTAVVYQIVHTEAPSIGDTVPGLPDELNAIVARALKKDPNERYASASDMASDLRLVKMILDLPLTTAGSMPASGAGTAPISIADKLHATGSITRSSVAGADPSIGAPGLQTRGPRPEVHKEPQTAPPSRGSRTGLIAAAIVGGVLILGGGAYVLFMSGGDAPAPETTPTPSAQASPTATPTASPAAAAAAAAKTADTVVISSQPAGARILLNGADTGRVTPASISLGGSDSGRVELSLKGFASASATLGAADLKRGRREFKLEPAAIPVRLTISGPYAFELRQGGQVISAAATSHDLTVQPGGGVTAHSDEYFLNEPVALDFKTAEVQASIRASGVLAVFAAIETCSIIVDGRNVGFPPLPRKPIAAGAHEVILRCPDGKEEARRITVAPGERITVTFRAPAP